MSLPGPPGVVTRAAPISAGVPSPQLIEKVYAWAGPKFGSVNVPTGASLSGWLDRVCRSPLTLRVGRTLATVTWNVAVPTPPSSSATATVTGNVPVSPYAWSRANVLPERASGRGPNPSP